MANIKLFGNTKIQGKAFFDLSAPEPTYSIEKSVSSVDEGASVTFTLTTTNVANGTSVPYTITGISAADITSGSLTGNFTVNSNTATVTITATADQLTEGAETATLTLDNVADFDSVTVNDTSLTPVPFSPDQITGLRGWWDYTHEVYRINGNDFTDATASVVMTIGGIPNTVQVSGTTNNKNSYGGLYWNNTSWVIDTVREAVYDDDGNLVQEAYAVTYTSSGNTQYPWQANWSGSEASVTRTATINSVLATNDQTIALWRNKITSNGNFGQTTLNLQPILRANGVQLSVKTLVSTGDIPLSFGKTYYIIAKRASSLTSGASRILATSGVGSTSSSSANLFRNALFARNNNGMKYGLSNRNLVYSSFSPNTTTYELISVSFDTLAQQGKIQINNQNEEILNGIGDSVFETTQLYLGSSGGNVDVKEILVYDGLHTSQQKTQVINYLNAKHNVF
jgi:hypothetical protein